jgi:type 1 glutamine amidotransferase
VLVLYDMIRDLDDDNKRANLRAFVEAGKGVVVLHHALGDSTDWTWWTEEVSGGRFPEHLQYKHDQQMPVTVVKPHPVTEGISDFVIEDETYKDMWISPKVQVLLRTTHPLSDGPVAWIGPNEKARVVTIQLGHGGPAHRNPNWQRLVKNAVLWTAAR